MLFRSRFKTKRDRQQNYNLLHGLLAEIFRAKPRDHWLALLRDGDVPCGPIYTLDQVFCDPQVRHLGLIKQLPHPKVGSVSLVTGGVSLSETPAEIRTLAPGHGQHTEEILARIGKRPSAGSGQA